MRVSACVCKTVWSGSRLALGRRRSAHNSSGLLCSIDDPHPAERGCRARTLRLDAHSLCSMRELLMLLVLLLWVWVDVCCCCWGLCCQGTNAPSPPY